MTRLLTVVAVAWLTAGLPVGAVAATAWWQSGGSIRGATGYAALGTLVGAPILAAAIKDWVR